LHDSAERGDLKSKAGVVAFKTYKSVILLVLNAIPAILGDTFGAGWCRTSYYTLLWCLERKKVVHILASKNKNSPI